MRKRLNYIIFGFIVLLVVGLAVNHSRRMRSLVDAMAKGAPDARAKAAEELIKAEQFMDAITGEPKETRAQVAEALEALGTPAAVKQTLPLLKDQDKPVRDRAIETLQIIGGKSLAHVKEILPGLKDGDGNVRKGSIIALTDLKNGIGPIDGLVEEIVKYMKAEAGARGPGGDVLGSPLFKKKGAASQALPLLMAQLDEPDEGVRVGATEALGKIGDKGAVSRLVTAMAKDSAQVRRVAIGAIALIADVSGEPALTEAIRNTEDDNEARAQAAAGLGKIATPSAIATLVNALNDDDLKLRSSAVAALARAARPASGGATNDQVVVSLIGALRDNREEVRLGAARALQVVQTEKANPTLLALLSDAKTEERLRSATALALGFPGNKAAVAPLIRALQDESGDVNAAAQDSLASIGADASEALVAALTGEETVAYSAAQALAKQGASALPLLQKTAEAGSVSAQRWAAVALGEMGLAEARPALERLASSADANVAFVAKDRLSRLGGGGEKTP